MDIFKTFSTDDRDSLAPGEAATGLDIHYDDYRSQVWVQLTVLDDSRASINFAVSKENAQKIGEAFLRFAEGLK